MARLQARSGQRRDKPACRDNCRDRRTCDILVGGAVGGVSAETASCRVFGFTARGRGRAQRGIDETRIEDTIKERPELLTPYAESCLESLGFNERRAESYCANAQKVYSSYEIDATTAAAHAGSEAVAYAICSVIFFLLIMLFISLIKQIFGLRFRITDNVDADLYGGAAFGFARGCIYCICLCWLLSFCGNMIGKTTLDDGLFSRFFLLLSNAADKLF